MTNSIETFIRKHRSELDVLEAPEGLWADIATALPNVNEKKLKQQVYTQRLGMAALLLVGVMGWGLWFFQTPTNETPLLSQEMQETEAFYTQKISSTINDIKTQKIAIANDPELSQTLTIRDSVYEQLLVELKLHPDNPQIIDKIVQYYQERLAFLERVKERLQRRQRTQNL